jgi:predicted ester cyclase
LLGEARTFPDAKEEIRILVAEGDTVAAQINFQGTQLGPLGTFPAGGRKLEADFACSYRLEDGRIAEAWVVWDGLDMLRQLGHVKT